MDTTVTGPRLTFEATRITQATRIALGRLGDELRRPGAAAWAGPVMQGSATSRADLEARVGVDALDELLDAGLAAAVGSQARLAFSIMDVGGILTAIPKQSWGDEVVYLGPDSGYLVEAAVRLAPRGDRAADLGTGTGLLAAVLASRYRTVVATDVSPSVAASAGLTLALNRLPRDHAAGVCVADVGRGLRDESFDLVVANAPWVPLADGSAESPELFAHGGDTGMELPRRFLLEGASLVRSGGVAITLALDMEVERRERPLQGVCERLRRDGYVVRVLPTPFNRDRPELRADVADRQRSLTDAVHVAVVVARPRPDDEDRASLLVAVDALGRRWQRAMVDEPDPSGPARRS